jgi:hypothetical protein
MRSTRSNTEGILYTKDDHDLIYRKIRSDKGKKKVTRRSSMATSRALGTLNRILQLEVQRPSNQVHWKKSKGYFR